MSILFLITSLLAMTKAPIEGEYIVFNNSEKIAGVKVLKNLGGGYKLIKTKNPATLKAFSLSYPNYQYFGNPMESMGEIDPQYHKQYHHKMIQSEQAWNYSKGESEIIIAVTDNEFAMDHDDLKQAWWVNKDEIPGNGIDDDQNGYIDDVNGWDFASGDNNPDHDGPTHGTHVAGIIAAAHNSIGVRGIAPHIKIMPLRWYGSGRWTTALIIETYMYAYHNGAKIISTSYNIDILVNDMAYRKMLKDLTSKGVLIVNSAGNDSEKDPPRSVIKELILVCSVKTNEKDADEKSKFSNYGEGIDICAPGDPILSTVRDRYQGRSRYGVLKGTSMATPVVAAAAALIWSRFPELNSHQVRRKLLLSTDDIDDKQWFWIRGKLGSGRLNLAKAVQ